MCKRLEQSLYFICLGVFKINKKMFSALTIALVVGAASTTFAAANPFSDVPAGHWAYDAVTQLAADGIIEGYGDGTYLGNRNITRYEMAQMIAKAMAKNPIGTDRSRDWNLKMLAAEFEEELNNLGVRVSNLEKYSDKVVWQGFLRYTYNSSRVEQSDGHKKKSNSDMLKFRFEPYAEVNDHWTLKTRIDADHDMMKDKGNNGEFKLVRAWAEGKYGNLNLKVGRLPMQLDPQFLFDTQLSGAAITYGKDLKLTAQAGRWNYSELNSSLKSKDDDPVNIQSIGLTYKKSKWNANAAYHHLETDNFKTSTYDKDADTDDANLWSVGLGYRFDKNIAIGGQYAHNAEADDYKKVYSIQLDYKGAKKSDQGSWGIYAAYRYLGQNVAFHPTYGANGGVDAGNKGWEFGTGYTLFKNVLLQAKYVNGKVLSTDRDAEKLFGRVEFFF